MQSRYSNAWKFKPRAYPKLVFFQNTMWQFDSHSEDSPNVPNRSLNDGNVSQRLANSCAEEDKYDAALSGIKIDTPAVKAPQQNYGSKDPEGSNKASKNSIALRARCAECSCPLRYWEDTNCLECLEKASRARLESDDSGWREVFSAKRTRRTRPCSTCCVPIRLGHVECEYCRHDPNRDNVSLEHLSNEDLYEPIVGHFKRDGSRWNTKEVAKRKHKYSNHSFDEMSDVSHLMENLMLFCYQLYNSNSMSGVFVACASCIKTFTGKSIVGNLDRYYQEYVVGHSNQSSDTFSFTGGDVVDWWNLVKGHKMWPRIKDLISVTLSVVSCDCAGIEWSYAGFEILKIEASKQQERAVDVIDNMITLFTWMFDSGVQAIKTRSVAPFLFTTHNAKQVNDMYDEIISRQYEYEAGSPDLANFTKKVMDCQQRISQMKKATDCGAPQIWLQIRYEKIATILLALEKQRKSTNIQEQPFGIALTGKTRVGKTRLRDLFTKIALKQLGYDFDESRVCTKAKRDRYDSNYYASTLVYHVDEFGSAKKDSTEGCPTDEILTMYNNVAPQAIKAELNSKGIIFMDFKVGTITSNADDLTAKDYATCPEAVLARFVHVRARVKDYYTDSGGASLNRDHPELQDEDPTNPTDVWDIAFEKCIATTETIQGGSGKKRFTRSIDSYRFEPHVWVDDEGVRHQCTNMTIGEACRAMKYLSAKHAREQKNFVRVQKAINNMKLCERCELYPFVCKCPPLVEDEESTVGCSNQSMDIVKNVIADGITSGIKGYASSFLIYPWWMRMNEYAPVSMMMTSELAHEIQSGLDSQTTWLLALVPECVYSISYLDRWKDKVISNTALRHFRKLSKFHWLMNKLFWIMFFIRLIVITFGIRIYGLKWDTCVFFLATTLCIIRKLSARVRIAALHDEYLDRRDVINGLVGHYKGKPLTLVGAGMLFMAALKAASVWNEYRKTTNQAAETATSWMSGIVGRVGLNVKTSPVSATSTSNELSKTFEKFGVFRCLYERDNGTTGHTNIVFLQKSVSLVNEHVFHYASDFRQQRSEWLNITVLPPKGNEWTFKIHYSHQSVVVGDLDMVMSYCPNCPDVRDKTCFLPLTHPEGSAPAILCGRDSENNYVSQGVHAIFEQLSANPDTKFSFNTVNGAKYKSTASNVGMCMSLLISQSKKPCITGFHFAGIQGVEGASQTLVKGVYDKALSQLSVQEGVVVSSHGCDMPTEIMGKKYKASDKAHPNSLSSRLEGLGTFEVLGSTERRNVQRSTVQDSVLSKHVESVFGVKSIYGPPNLDPNWLRYNQTLEHLVNPSDMFLPGMMQKASLDYKAPLKKFFTDSSIKPLGDSEITAGVRGSRFIKAMDMTTSMGYPVFGPKNRWFEPIFDEDGYISGHSWPPEIVVEYDRLLSSWRNGNRAYPACSAFLKDEATSTPEKVRVVQAAQCAMTMAIRKFYLPIAAKMQEENILSEMAIGVDRNGPPWAVLMDHVRKFDSEQVLAWDYSKFDARMSSQMTRAALTIMIDFAKGCKYGEEDINMMCNMITDICHPVTDYDGSLIMLFGSNPSGNPLTVVLNSIVNSLYIRIAYFDEFPEDDFRDNVALITYGDDGMASVRKDKRKFNFSTMKTFFAKHGVKVTPPDKSEGAFEFMSFEDADFLKCKSQYIEEIGTEIGKLDEVSIFKRLHANTTSSACTKEEVALNCIADAMFDWFAHGRQVYEERREQMKEVCALANLDSTAIHLSFDDRVENWKNRYK